MGWNETSLLKSQNSAVETYPKRYNRWIFLVSTFTHFQELVEERWTVVGSSQFAMIRVQKVSKAVREAVFRANNFCRRLCRCCDRRNQTRNPSCSLSCDSVIHVVPGHLLPPA